ncbi:atp-binding cassette sub-family a (abc1) member 3b [Anaeramoeba flamelloides]|uniref:Atp-binding cassette sub-family a (Abc1) member 3b n=1 Tax=Anaeramoeba flamelloides TaxID=1746091 RepID=A0AAV7YP76_9EUKA|nr:atp-binding cassette sub-family a (abc1) member 3b [Anaeramoeba flamelloides]
MATIKNILVSSLTGVILGELSTLITSGVCIKLNLSKGFAIVFGIILIVLSLAFLYRLSKEKKNSANWQRVLFVFIISIFVLCSGIFSFVLATSAFHNAHNDVKIICFLFLSVSLTFALTYVIVEIFNIPELTQGTAIIASPSQMYVLFAITGVLGISVGMLVGHYINIYTSNTKTLFKKSVIDTIPFGCMLGFIAGLVNEILRVKVKKSYSPIKDGDRDDVDEKDKTQRSLITSGKTTNQYGTTNQTDDELL